MTNFIMIFGAGGLGIFLHWGNRWLQRRTQSTFMEYMTANINYSIGSIMANVTASSGFYSSLPTTPDDKEFILTLIASLTTGFASDSVINRDVPQNIAELPVLAVTPQEKTVQNTLVEKTIEQIKDIRNVEQSHD